MSNRATGFDIIFPSRVARLTDSESSPFLRGFAITHTGHTTLNRTPLEE